MCSEPPSPPSLCRLLILFILRCHIRTVPLTLPNMRQSTMHRPQRVTQAAVGTPASHCLYQHYEASRHDSQPLVSNYCFTLQLHLIHAASTQLALLALLLPLLQQPAERRGEAQPLWQQHYQPLPIAKPPSPRQPITEHPTTHPPSPTPPLASPSPHHHHHSPSPSSCAPPLPSATVWCVRCGVLGCERL